MKKTTSMSGSLRLRIVFIAGVLLLLGPGAAFAAEESAINAGDTAWVMISTALVMLMTPGLAFFYSGMVRKRNFLSTMMQSFLMLCLISLQWVLVGYTLAFGPDIGGVIGGLDFFGLLGVGMEAKGTIPHIIFMLFQGMFAVITVALITGAFAERIKFSAFVIFALVWTTLVYDPLCHWVWGGGWLGGDGALDFAGGTVVHISAGVSALVFAIVIGKRRGYPQESMPPHNLGWTLLGTGLLWFGWFGFNAGSALAADGIAALAFVTTNTAAAAGGVAWVLIEWIRTGKPTALGAASGAVAGLVAITPGAGFVEPMWAIVIGLGGGVFCYLGVSWLKPKLGYDDTLDVFGIHGIGGIWGAIATGLFATVGAKGAFFGNPEQVLIQLKGVVATAILAGVVTYVTIKILSVTIGIRVSKEDEAMGLDLSQHGESGYN
ncbi:Ammonium transporter [hydrothermal vent metagenome]|uniref:Ammonium transporter n=1 Tax=hydrothermal vent metagenome TaxID=652676 RepID=A0A3B0QWC3_9ZZZZ